LHRRSWLASGSDQDGCVAHVIVQHPDIDERLINGLEQVATTFEAPTMNPPVGQEAEVPVQLSATSHAPAAGRQTVPAAVNPTFSIPDQLRSLGRPMRDPSGRKQIF
jgi:hypothetical protein